METVLRVAIFYFVVLAGIRIMGKREFSQMSPFELVTLLLIPELVSQSIIREDFSIANGIIAVCSLFVIVFLMSLLSHRFRRVERAVAGTSSILIQNGRMVPHTMDLERVSPDELFGEMRKAGLERLEQVKWGILEGDGRFSFIPAPGQEEAHHRPDEKEGPL